MPKIKFNVEYFHQLHARGDILTLLLQDQLEAAKNIKQMINPLLDALDDSHLPQNVQDDMPNKEVKVRDGFRTTLQSIAKICDAIIETDTKSLDLIAATFGISTEDALENAKKYVDFAKEKK